MRTRQFHYLTTADRHRWLVASRGSVGLIQEKQKKNPLTEPGDKMANRPEKERQTQ